MSGTDNRQKRTTQPYGDSVRSFFLFGAFPSSNQKDGMVMPLHRHFVVTVLNAEKGRPCLFTRRRRGHPNHFASALDPVAIALRRPTPVLPRSGRVTVPHAPMVPPQQPSLIESDGGSGSDKQLDGTIRDAMDSGRSDGGDSLVVAAGHASTTSGRGAVGSTPTGAARRALVATYARVSVNIPVPGGAPPSTPPQSPAAAGSATAAPS